MEIELKAIQETLRELESELQTQKSKPKSSTEIMDPESPSRDPKADPVKFIKYKGDKFTEVVEAFLSSARKQLANVETSTADMASKVSFAIFLSNYIIYNFSVCVVCILFW